MNKIKSAFIVAILLSVSAHLFGESFEVSYASGLVEVKIDSKWTKLSIGTKLASDAQLKLASQSTLEVKTDKGVLFFRAPGVFDLASVYKASNQDPKLSFASKKFTGQKLVQTSGSTKITVGGTRAGAQDKNSLNLMVDEEEKKSDPELENKILKAISDGSYDESLSLIKQGYSGNKLEKSWLQLQEASVLVNQEHFGAAASLLEKITISSSNQYFLNKQNLLLQTYFAIAEYDKAIKTSSDLIGSNEVDFQQIGYLLRAFSLQGKGNNPEAKANFEKAMKINPENELGRSAAEAMRG